MLSRFLLVAAILTWAVATCNAASASVNYSQLKEKLSASARIVLPGSGVFDDLTSRWSNLSTPVANVVVVPGTEKDVIQIVGPPFMCLYYHSLLILV